MKCGGRKPIKSRLRPPSNEINPLPSPLLDDYKGIASKRFPRRGTGSSWRTRVNELARYLLEHIVIDFDGAITIEQVRQFLRSEDNRQSRALLARLIEDKGGIDDLMVTVADCLKDHIRTGINEETVRGQLVTYSES